MGHVQTDRTWSTSGVQYMVHGFLSPWYYIICNILEKWFKKTSLNTCIYSTTSFTGEVLMMKQLSYGSGTWWGPGWWSSGPEAEPDESRDLNLINRLPRCRLFCQCQWRQQSGNRGHVSTGGGKQWQEPTLELSANSLSLCQLQL